MNMVRNTNGEPTPAQIAFLERLTAERQVSAATVEADLDTLRAWLAAGATRGHVSALIERLKGLPRRAVSTASVSDVQIGVYASTTDANDIYRVYKARGGSHLLVKRITGSHETGWVYDYAGPASRVLRGLSLRKLTAEEAGTWGRRLGRCCACERTLTDGESIDLGYGPICRRYFV